MRSNKYAGNVRFGLYFVVAMCCFTSVHAADDHAVHIKYVSENIAENCLIFVRLDGMGQKQDGHAHPQQASPKIILAKKDQSISVEAIPFGRLNSEDMASAWYVAIMPSLTGVQSIGIEIPDNDNQTNHDLGVEQISDAPRTEEQLDVLLTVSRVIVSIIEDGGMEGYRDQQKKAITKLAGTLEKDDPAMRSIQFILAASKFHEQQREFNNNGPAGSYAESIKLLDIVCDSETHDPIWLMAMRFRTIAKAWSSDYEGAESDVASIKKSNSSNWMSSFADALDKELPELKKSRAHLD